MLKHIIYTEIKIDESAYADIYISHKFGEYIQLLLLCTCKKTATDHSADHSQMESLTSLYKFRSPHTPRPRRDNGT